MHIFLAALAHETNSFSPIPTTLRAFGEGILYRPRDGGAQRAEALGFPGYGLLLETASVHGDTVTCGLCAWAQPGGPVARAVYESLRDELLGQLAAAGPVDAVFLVLHGAMIAHGYPDCEGDLLERVRALVGPGVPVGALLDLHATLTPACWPAARSSSHARNIRTPTTWRAPASCTASWRAWWHAPAVRTR